MPRGQGKEPTPGEVRAAVVAGVVAVAAGIVTALIADAAGASRYLGTPLVLFVAFLVLAVYAWADPAPRLELLGKLTAPVGIVLLSTGAVAFFGLLEEQDNPSPPPFGCIPGSGPIEADIAMAGGRGAIVHRRATPASSAVRQLPGGCHVRFTGYCIGATVRDASEPLVPDSRWLILEDVGLVSNGDTVGDPPPGRPIDCPGSIPPPDRLDFKSAELDAASGRYVSLTASSPRAAYVGFARRLPDGSWQRIGWDYTPGDARGEAFDLETRAGSTSVAASACIGYRTPSGPVRTRPLMRGKVRFEEKRRTVQQPVDRNPAIAACDAGVTQAATE